MSIDGQMVAYVTAIAELKGVRPPKIARAIEPPALDLCGFYHPDSRTITVPPSTIDNPERLPETLLHEFQHYLDDLYGTELRGSLRGTHDRSFYRRLNDLKQEVANSIRTEASR